MDYNGMQGLYGKGPRGRFCSECGWAKRPKSGEEYLEGEFHCKPEGSRYAFVVADFFPACGHFQTPGRIERERMEAQGQRTIPFATYGTVKKVCYDLAPGVELADQDWTTPGFWPRTVQ